MSGNVPVAEATMQEAVLPVRVDDRHRSNHPAQRQALVQWRDGTQVDRHRDARSREAVPQGDRLHRPTAPRGRDRTTTPPSTVKPHPNPRGRDRSHCVTITTGPPSPEFHGRRGNPRPLVGAGLLWLLRWECLRAPAREALLTGQSMLPNRDLHERQLLPFERGQPANLCCQRLVREGVGLDMVLPYLETVIAAVALWTLLSMRRETARNVATRDAYSTEPSSPGELPSAQQLPPISGR